MVILCVGGQLLYLDILLQVQARGRPSPIIHPTISPSVTVHCSPTTAIGVVTTKKIVLVFEKPKTKRYWGADRKLLQC